MKCTFINKKSVSLFVQIEKDKSLCKGLSFIFVPFVLVFLPDKNVQREINGSFGLKCTYITAAQELTIYFWTRAKLCVPSNSLCFFLFLFSDLSIHKQLKRPSRVRCPGVRCLGTRGPGIRCLGVRGPGIRCLRGAVGDPVSWRSSVSRSKIRGQTSGGQVSGGQMSFNPPWSFELREIRVKSF